MQEFSFKSIEKLKYYVYALIDPRKKRSKLHDRIFYVGKGKDNRCFQHAMAAKSWRKAAGEPNPKLKTIRQIHRKTGQPPPVHIVCHGLDEASAHRIEAILIKLLGTNDVHGHNAEDYWLTTKELDGEYNEPIRQSQLPGKFFIVSLNGFGDDPAGPWIPESHLKDRTLGIWTILEEKAKEIDFVAGVFQGRIVCVFKVRKKKDGSAQYTRWKHKRSKNGRRIFKTKFRGDRCLAVEEKFQCRRVVDSRGKVLTKFSSQQSCKVIGKKAKDA